MRGEFNAVIGSFFHILKAEVYYQKQLDTLEEVISAVSSWIGYYNFTRTKRKLSGFLLALEGFTIRENAP
jgi:putative transposase